MIFIKSRKYKKIDDGALLDLLLKEQTYAPALNELFNRYSLLVMGISLKYLPNKEIAEEITIDVFTQLKEKVEKYEIKNFRSWLYSTARNACLMQLRKKDPEIKTDAFKHTEAEDDVAWKIEEEKNFQRLETAIGALKSDQQRCIKLFYFQKKCYEEIAAMTEFSIKEVKSHLQNGKRNLKIKLERDE